MRPELIVAGKEFRDHITSRRFILIFAILLLISIYVIATGMSDYNKSIESYKTSQQQNQQEQWFKDQVQSLQQQIQDAVDRGAAQEEIDSLQYQLDMMLNPPMPSMLTVLGSLSGYFALIGMVLGIAMGFDLITREKEEGSLKSLLSHPVYRDAVINGKTLGAAAVLVTTMGATVLITVAIMLFFSVIPSADDLLRIVAFFVLAMLYCLAFFAVAMAASTLAKSSSMAVLYALGIVITLAILAMFSYPIATFLAGPQPQMDVIPPGVLEKDIYVNGSGAASSLSSNTTYPADMPAPTIAPVPIAPGEPTPGGPTGWEEWQKYNDRLNLYLKALSSISPMTNFQSYIAPAMFNDNLYPNPIVYESSLKRPSYGGSTTVWDALGSVWMNILVMIAETIAAFAVAFVVFLRMDIR